jgi:hypothetical protein
LSSVIRASELVSRKRLEMDRIRVLRMMESSSQDLQKAKINLASNDMPDLHDLPGKQVWKRVEKNYRVGTEWIYNMKDKTIAEVWKPPPSEEGTGKCEVSGSEASMSMGEDVPVTM